MNETKRSWAVLAGLIVLASALFNWRFVFMDYERLSKMVDVVPIVNGYHSTPNLLRDGAAWWYGPWLYEGMERFRPLASYLYWVDCWLGFNIGWWATGLLTFVIFTISCLLVAALVYRFTQSRFSAVSAGVLCSAIHYFNSGDPAWLGWFPNSDNLLSAALMLFALLAFDCWNSTRRASHLTLTWLCFVAACLTKETAWAFPAMAATLVFLRQSVAPRRYGFFHAGAMMAAVAMLASYKSAVVPNAPGFNLAAMQRADIFVSTHPLVSSFMLGEYWIVACAFAVSGFVLSDSLRDFAGRHLFKILIGASTLSALLMLMLPDTIYFAYRVAEHWQSHLYSIGQVAGLLIVGRMAYRQRDLIPSVSLAFILVILAYLQAVPYMAAHWHYTVAAWFFLCIGYGVFVAIAERYWMSQKATQPERSLNRHKLPGSLLNRELATGRNVAQSRKC